MCRVINLLLRCGMDDTENDTLTWKTDMEIIDKQGIHYWWLKYNVWQCDRIRTVKLIIHWNGKAVRVTALVFTGDVEDKLQRLQRIPRLSPWRPFRFCVRDRPCMTHPALSAVIIPLHSIHCNPWNMYTYLVYLVLLCHMTIMMA